MVEFHAGDNIGNLQQLKATDHGQKLSFLSAMEEGMNGGLKAWGAGAAEGFKNSINIDSAKLSNSETSQRLAEKHLPSLDISGMKGVLSGTIQNEKANVEKAANLIDETNTLGTDDQKEQLTKMFEDEYKKAADVTKRLGGDERAAKLAGEQAVRNMVAEINEELKDRNSESRISLERPQVSLSDLGGWKDPGAPDPIGNIVVRRNSDQTDHIALHEPTTTGRGAIYQFNSSLDGVTLETKK